MDGGEAVTVQVLHGDCREVLATLPDASVQCCVTSPPYYGLRDYGVDGQMGLERSPDEYVAGMVVVFREVRRVLRDYGTLWLNIGDSYHNYRTHMNGGAPTNTVHVGGARDGIECFGRSNRNTRLPGIKDKDLIGIPWMLAFALRADGWYLRSDIIWHKPNPMPESVRDRPTKAHEYVFLLTKSARYFFDAEAIKEQGQDSGAPDAPINDTNWDGRKDGTVPGKGETHKSGTRKGGNLSRAYSGVNWAERGRNTRTIWTIATQPFSGAHFATMPPDLAERCIKAGSKPGDIVLDPFGGAGTTGLVADRLGRNALLIELNPEYADMARERIRDDAPLLGVVA